MPCLWQKCLLWTVIVSYLYGKNPSSGDEENSLPQVHASYEGAFACCKQHHSFTSFCCVWSFTAGRKTAYNAVSTREIDRAFVYEGWWAATLKEPSQSFFFFFSSNISDPASSIEEEKKSSSSSSTNHTPLYLNSQLTSPSSSHNGSSTPSR